MKKKDAYQIMLWEDFIFIATGRNKTKAPNIVDEIGNILLETHSHYYTCHCTGIESYNRLKAVMGENIGNISTGEQLTLAM